jgi:hypothetical protein
MNPEEKEIDSKLLKCLKVLVEKSEYSFIKYKEEREDMKKYISFCDTHKFNEEVRITSIKLMANADIFSEHKYLIGELRNILNKIEKQ